MTNQKVQIFKAAPPGIGWPLAGFCVHAGFESPGTDNEEDRISLDAHVSSAPNAVYYIKVKGNCMENSGIYEDDFLVVDRSLSNQVQNGDVVYGVLDGMLLLAVFVEFNGKRYLMPDNIKDYPFPYEIHEYTEFNIEGVVSHNLLNQRKQRHVRANRLQQFLRELRKGVPAGTKGQGRRSA
jgi:DNA polymerase V